MSHHFRRSGTRRITRALVFCTVISALSRDDARSGEGSTNLVREVPGLNPKVSVDSTFPGYGTSVLSDGKWIEKGKEITEEPGHRDRLGNLGNTWVSSETDAEHWIRVDWPRPVTIDEVEIWWSVLEWQPRAFRVELLGEGKSAQAGEEWTPAHGAAAWFQATDRRSSVPLEPLEVVSLRIVQPPGGGGGRSLMAAQEVLAFHRGGGAGPRAGVRDLSAAEVRRLKARELTRNLARLECPGAASALAWLSSGRAVPAGRLADGDLEAAVPLEEDAVAFGIRWPIEHVLDGLAATFAGEAPDPGALVPEFLAAECTAGDTPATEARAGAADGGETWIPVRAGLAFERKPAERRLSSTFEPLATRGIRLRSTSGRPPAVTELEALRYLPPAKDSWPARLVEKGRLEEEILASSEDPSFEALASCALPMTPARALLGLKDAPDEVGIAWDGTAMGSFPETSPRAPANAGRAEEFRSDGLRAKPAVSRETMRFYFGRERDCLADCRDTVRRLLIDGWRPGTVVEGRLGSLAVRETAFVAPLEGPLGSPALFVRIEITNLGDDALAMPLQVEISGPGPQLRVEDGVALRGDQVALLSRPPCRADGGGGLLRLDLALGPRESVHADLACPRVPISPGPALEPYRRATFDGALAGFRTYWDQLLEGAARIEVPDARIQRMYKAVLAQVFINGDGDIMRYGSEPSVYRQEIFGVEEGYAMLALALLGFGADAQRYLDGTYLTREFLRKVDAYESAEDRHQQYRNGLEPHYAVSVYRLTRDAGWIRKHLPLLRDCAEWTIAQRRRTMSLEDGRKPLHWGLLPEWAYGGDISEVKCHALYGNYCCWRGLADTAWLLEEQGDSETARRYRAEAREYRAAIDRAVDASYVKDRRPPFLPLRLYANQPDEQMDYYQLFAGCILDLAPFEKGSKHLRWISDFLEEDNRMFCCLPRFRRDVGPGGLDALYGKGSLLSKLQEDSVREFLLGFHAYMAFNMDRETFASRETNVLYASDLHVRSRYEVPDMSDPVPCSSAVALQLLRHMLVSEEAGGPGELSGDLLLLAAAPRSWLRDGQAIRIAGAPTCWGPVSLAVRSLALSGRIEAEISPPRRSACRAIRLRLRHPEARPLRSVTVDGVPWREFDPAGEWITLPGRSDPCRVVATY